MPYLGREGPEVDVPDSFVGFESGQLNDAVETKDVLLPGGLPKQSFATTTRGRVIMCLFLCNACMYLSRANMSVAVVYMYSDQSCTPADCMTVQNTFSRVSNATWRRRSTQAEVCSVAKQYVTATRNCVDAGWDCKGGFSRTEDELRRDRAACKRSARDGGWGCGPSDCRPDDTHVTLKGIILSSFYVGYLVLQVPGGFLAGRYGGKNVLAVAVAAWTVGTLLTYPAYLLGPAAVVASRVLVGIAESVNYPCQCVLVSKWVPRNEVTRAWGFVCAGEPVGTMIALFVCPFITDWAGTWTVIFWLSAGCSVAWVGLFMYVVYATPEEHPRIGVEEQLYILDHRSLFSAPQDAPWRQFLTHPAMLAQITMHVCFNYGYFVGLSWLPSYFDSMFNVNYSQMGFFSVLPYISNALVEAAAGTLADKMLAKPGANRTGIRKWFNAVGAVLTAVCFFSLRWLQPCDVSEATFDSGCRDFNLAALLTTLAIASTGITVAGGYNVNFLDLSPRFSGHIYGVSNTFASIPGVVGQLVTGAILAGHGDDWGLVFMIPAVFSIVGTVVFSLFARSDVVFQ
eukprot:TRINITY_DN12366_c0_g2_i4.p1 TRINITY_DN12366_c0_g2~~TRINITY_DN12366_c0_g2_i4.p1  ORF type:complete len:569 (+),score=156.48 TRINITY_DN12366_c0_g2_i4:64-1770(+)